MPVEVKHEPVIAPIESVSLISMHDYSKKLEVGMSSLYPYGVYLNFGDEVIAALTSDLKAFGQALIELAEQHGAKADQS